MMAQDAAYWREHRQAFELAQQLRITPAQARATLAQRAAQARHAEAEARLARRMAATGTPPPIAQANLTLPEATARPQWWNKD